ncbi:MAG: hypothetical protein ACXQTD_07700 [Candidatus Syntropharchaeia archaeon]
MLDDGRISREELYKRLERAGKILLHADRMYLQSDEAVLGHLFVSFLALYGYCKLQMMLRNAGLL